MVAQTQKKRALSVERLPEGSTIGRQYRVVRLLGHGGLAWVYEVIDEPTGVPCAVKIFHPFFLSGEPRTSMLRERLAKLRTLTHPNLNEVYGCAAHGLVQMQVCALCPGQSLDQFALRQLSRSPNQRVNDALTIAISAARAVGFASASLPGVFHGAIKPGNIRIRTDQTVMVLDFGLADIFDPGHVVALARRNNVTQYMAPELRDGVGLANARTDVYSLGAIFYHALTGQTPGMTVADPAQIFMFLPEQVSALCMRATHANPSERFNTPDEFAIAAADELERRIASGERIPSSTNHDRQTSSTADAPRRTSSTGNPSPRSVSTPSMPGFDPTITPFDPAMRPHTPGSSPLPGGPGAAHRPLADEPRAASSGGAGSLLSAYATATERASHPAPVPDSATRPEPRQIDSVAEEAFFTQSFSAVPEEIRNTPASLPHAFHGVDAATVAKTAQPAATTPAPTPKAPAPDDADALSAARAEASIAELQRALVETGPLPKLADSIGDIQRLGDDFDPPKTAPDLPSVAEAPLAPARPNEPKPTTGNLPPHETSVENWLFAGGAAPIPTPEERASREEVFVQSASFAATQGTPQPPQPVQHPPHIRRRKSRFPSTRPLAAATQHPPRLQRIRRQRHRRRRRHGPPANRRDRKGRPRQRPRAPRHRSPPPQRARRAPPRRATPLGKGFRRTPLKPRTLDRRNRQTRTRYRRQSTRQRLHRRHAPHHRARQRANLGRRRHRRRNRHLSQRRAPQNHAATPATRWPRCPSATLPRRHGRKRPHHHPHRRRTG